MSLFIKIISLNITLLIFSKWLFKFEVIFRANKTNIFVRHTQVNFRANNLIYWFVGMEVQLLCELTV